MADDQQAGPGLYVKLGLNVDGMLGGIGGVSLALNQSLELFSKFEGMAQGFVDLANNAGRMAKEIKDNARDIGMSTTEYQQWTHAAIAAGSSAEEITGSIRMMSVRMKEASDPTSEMGRTLKALNVNVLDSSGKMRSMNDVLLDIFPALNNLPEGFDRNQAAMILFGRNFKNISDLASLTKEELLALIDQAPVFSPEKITQLDAYNTQMKLLNERMERSKALAGSELVGSFSTWGNIIDASLQKGQPLFMFFKDLNLLLEMTGEGITLLGARYIAFSELVQVGGPKFGNFEEAAKTISAGDAAVVQMRSKFALFESGYVEVPEKVTSPPSDATTDTNYKKILAGLGFGGTGGGGGTGTGTGVKSGGNYDEYLQSIDILKTAYKSSAIDQDTYNTAMEGLTQDLQGNVQKDINDKFKELNKSGGNYDDKLKIAGDIQDDLNLLLGLTIIDQKAYNTALTSVKATLSSKTGGIPPGATTTNPMGGPNVPAGSAPGGYWLNNYHYDENGNITGIISSEYIAPAWTSGGVAAPGQPGGTGTVATGGAGAYDPNYYWNAAEGLYVLHNYDQYGRPMEDAFGVPVIYPPGPPTGPGAAGTQSPVATYARGGIVRKPTLAVIGEAGPEAIIPLTGTGGAKVIEEIVRKHPAKPIEKTQPDTGKTIEPLTKHPAYPSANEINWAGLYSKIRPNITIPETTLKIPQYATGGIVNQPTLAMVGEAGPEAIIPLTGSVGKGTITVGEINIISPQGTPAQNAAAVQRALRDLGQSLGSGGGI